MSKTVAIVLAAGKGKRMHSDVPKQFLTMEGKPVLFYSLEVFQKSFVDEIVLVAGEEEHDFCRREIVDKYNFTKVSKIVAGGKERYHSVYNGLCAIDSADYVFVHDGARPFVSMEILNRNLEAAQKYQACVTGMPVKDTIKIADDEEFVANTPRRDTVWMIQTPQTFRMDLIKDAYSRLIKEENTLASRNILVTDDAMVAETFGNIKVKLVEGAYTNVKITTPEDMEVAAQFLKKGIMQENCKNE